MSGDSISFRDVDARLRQASQLLSKHPDEAERILSGILRRQPDNLNATVLLTRALRAQRKSTDAMAVLDKLCAQHPGFAVAPFERALAQLDRRQLALAVSDLRQAVAIDPALPGAWLVLGDTLFGLKDGPGADAAYMRHIELAGSRAPIKDAAKALAEQKLEQAEVPLRRHLQALPTDIAALAVLGEVVGRRGDLEQAVAVLDHCVSRAPSFDAARYNYAVVLSKLQRWQEAVEHTNVLAHRGPLNADWRTLHATCLSNSGANADALATFESLIVDAGDDAAIWTAYGHALRGSRRQADAIGAFRRAIDLAPDRGHAYWALANLKTAKFAAAEISTMGEHLRRDHDPDSEKPYFHFALAKALEDEGLYEESFRHYVTGNALQKQKLGTWRDSLAVLAPRLRALFTSPFFEKRANAGCLAPDPIFIVGLPRSGSTLLEQILASHSQVEGTAELPDLRSIVDGLHAKGVGGNALVYPEALAGLSDGDLHKLGEDYIARTRRHRRTSRPHFTDKMPANFEHVGLIRLILPRARVVDARRHPMACCFSNFKQLYANGNSFSYDLETLGRHYSDYVELMSHFDEMLPGFVHRVRHEDLVTDSEKEVRRLLDYCGLEFEETCLKFYENDRMVRTVSSEQVRRPIFADGVDQWRNFEPWLEPLKQALQTSLGSD